jgi:HSP20 family protein
MLTTFQPASDVFGELNRLQNVFDQVFRPLERPNIRARSGATFPVINVGVSPENIEIMAMAPGLDPGSLQVTVERDVLVISGERKPAQPEQENRTGVYAQERFSGAFRRVVSLPDDADTARVAANYRDGILRITVAKRESTRPRRIDIS